MPQFNPSDYINEDSFKDLFDNAHDLIHFVDLDGRIIYVNNSWSKLTGYELEEIQGKPIYSLIQDSDLSFFKDYRNDIVDGIEKEGEVILGIKKKDRTTIILEGFVSLRKRDGKALYTRGIFRDITARLKNAAALKEREFNLQQLLLNAPDAVIVINNESKIIFWNPMAEFLFGWTTGEAIGTNLAEKIIPEKYRTAHYHGMKRYLTTGEAHVLNKTIEITAINKDGNEFNISLTISNTTQKDGAPAFIAFIRDISELKMNEHELEKKRLQLEISNEQLQQFAHVASHDMKEPVRKIKLFTERLETEFAAALPSTAKTFLARIQNSADRLKTIIDGFLNYASINNINEAYETIELRSIIRLIETDLEMIIAEKKAKILYDNFPVFEGIPFLIQQLFYNLIFNSLKFSKAGVEPVVEITAATKQPGEITAGPAANNETAFIEVTVKDNGIGFSDAYSEKIFKTFTRLNSQKDYDGLGLGLSLAKNIMERHKGFITARGEINAGATFTLLLPLHKL